MRGGVLLREGASAFGGGAGLERARAVVASYEPQGEAQARERERILAFCDAHADALLRSCVPGHLTASALVVDSAGERALLTHHRKLDRWLQLGGHVDGDGELARSALREAIEESGIANLAVDPRVVDVDVHAIPARTRKDGSVEPEHLHLDVRFLVVAPEGAREVVSDESHDLGWFGPTELDGIDVDESVLRLFRIAFGKGR
ncbi:MAG: NUDIX hydrolase [Planctomycetota bacterium]